MLRQSKHKTIADSIKYAESSIMTHEQNKKATFDKFSESETVSS